MIVTLTANPSVDRTVELAGALRRGEVQRAIRVGSDPGGKGVNVARAVTAAGRLAVAVLPAEQDDPMLLDLRDRGVPHRPVPVAGRVRVNLTIAEPDGTTTKVNEPGLRLDDDVLEALARVLMREAAGARWAVLSGSLPPGVSPGWYAELVTLLRGTGARVAVDTSGAPLLATLAPGVAHLPDLVKPNADELADAVGTPVDERDPASAATAARRLVDRGVGAVLATLGAHGAVLVTPDGTWLGVPAPVAARSTVGAGDSSLAGYLLADLDDADPERRLRVAVAYGTAAVALPGSAMPTPTDVHPDHVEVTRLDGAHRPPPQRHPVAEPSAEKGSPR